MKSLAEIIKEKLSEKQKIEKQERRFLNKQIDDIHHSPQEKILRRKENWKRYIAWLKEHRTPDSTKAQSEFKKSKKFLREYKSLWYFTSHIKTQDLYYIVSQMKDRMNRGTSASAWLLSNTKNKPVENQFAKSNA